MCSSDRFPVTIDSDLATVTNLTITGTIDATDFKAMRDDMPLLATLDLSGATIAEYTGTEGTANTTSITYPKNTVPENAFLGKLSLTTITLPVGTTAIADYAFYFCKGLTGTIDLPTSIKSIGNLAFTYCSGISAVTIPASVTSMGTMAFMSCSALLNVDNNNPNFSSVLVS